MTTASTPTRTECIWNTPELHVYGVKRAVDGVEQTIGCFAYCGKAPLDTEPRGITREQHFELAK
jgi:hypothetical protein